MTDIKTAALLACARAYYDRGANVQYDQYSMDRVLQLTPRRRIYQPPEAGTEQNTLYLDCSGFIHAAYYNTFGKTIPATLTWHMIDHVKPRILYCQLTHEETEDELRELAEKIRLLLRPGDVITYELHLGNGHTMMVLNDHQMIHCSQHGHLGSYDYSKRCNRHINRGFMWIDSLDDLFGPLPDGRERNFLFSSRVKRFAISRPLECFGEPTEEALLRLKGCTGLRCAVTTSHPGGRQACPGDTVHYTVRVDNLTEETQEAKILFKAPAGTVLLSGIDADRSIPPGKTLTMQAAVRVGAADRICLDGPEVRVNGMQVFAPRVLLRRAGSTPEKEALIRRAADAVRGGDGVMSAVAEVFRGCGVAMEPREQPYALTCFHQFDAVAGCVLARLPQNPRQDLAVYGMFGGSGVITPEMAYSEHVRTTQLRLRDLESGDVIWCSDDPYGIGAYACLFTGDSLLGVFESGGETQTLQGAEMERFIDSLFGRYAFLLLRPWQAMN